jgi:carboxymethylenebutenolidase
MFSAHGRLYIGATINNNEPFRPEVMMNPSARLFLTACLGVALAQTAVSAPVRSQTVQYRSGRETVSGFLVLPSSEGKHPALVVVHEWWGLVPWVKEQAERLAAHGYVALAVDLYRGATTTQPSQASKLARSLPPGRALRDLQAAFHYLASRPDVNASKIGVIGWCMGGGWALRLAEHQPHLAACVVNYGELPRSSAQIQSIGAPVLGNFGGNDRGIPPSAVKAFAADMKAAGKSIDVKVYPGAGHAFENPNNRLGYRSRAARGTWTRTLAFLRGTLQ